MVRTEYHSGKSAGGQPHFRDHFGLTEYLFDPVKIRKNRAYQISFPIWYALYVFFFRLDYVPLMIRCYAWYFWKRKYEIFLTLPPASGTDTLRKPPAAAAPAISGTFQRSSPGWSQCSPQPGTPEDPASWRSLR